MKPLQRVNYFPELEVRNKSGERIIKGISVPFESPTFIREQGEEFWEEFQRGACLLYTSPSPRDRS